MARFRKKPVVIDAEQFNGNNNPFGVVQFQRASEDSRSDKHYVNTLEGPLIVSVGDFVIRGVKGEYYPCKPDIFAETYETAE